MDYLEGAVTTIGHLAWPLTAVAVAAVARHEVRRMFAALAKRIEEGSAVSLTKDGLEIKAAVQAQEAKLVSLQAQQDQVKSIALKQLDPTTRFSMAAAAPSSGAIDGHLRKMADDYMAIDIADWSERTRAKNKLAEDMAFYIVSNHVSKDALAKEKHEGLLIALAEAITLSADSGDADRLLSAAKGATRLHVRYRVLIALTKLLERSLLSIPQLGAVRELLKEYATGADASLSRQIANVTSLLNESVHPKM